MRLICFLPCRRGSERIANKNTRPFAHFGKGLLEVKLGQLVAAACTDRVIVSTNDEEVAEFAESLGEAKVHVVPRPDHLGRSDTSTDDLIAHVPDLIDEGHVLWTHVTSPFVTADEYDRIAGAYEAKLDGGFDSLMTVTAIRGFVWDRDGPVNYDPSVERWPRTQTVQPLYEVNSAAFVSSIESYRRRADRIGEQPYLYLLDRIRGLDIDWMEDFHVAEALLAAGRAAV